MLCKEPLLQYPYKEILYTLFTNVSQYAYSGVLTHPVKGPENLRFTEYISDSFSYTQQIWSSCQKGGLS